ncbi:MAG: hypothetical protein H6806_01880 [Planctomycetes bacterium]|nr:hypothetical protein [Planctomycetota bacterium]MCB9828499.1 hypothetical protein [Planctomycetota bacterium]MCB9900266.1 hypothetical protein [Planctomycetota bacterium]
MSPDLSALSSLLLAVVLGLAAWPARAWAPRRRAVFLGLLGLLLLLGPLVVAREASWPLRVLAGMGVPIVVLKLRDLHVASDWWRQQHVARWALAILVPFVLVPRAHAAAPRPPRRVLLRRLVIGSLEVAVGVLLWRSGLPAAAAEHGFVVEHVTRVLLLYMIAFDGGLAVLGAALSLVGVARLRFTHHPILASTPADFWRRYNLEAGRWFHHDVFTPEGGRRHPVRTVLQVFLVSGLLHEYLSAVLVGRVQGYQTAFFLLHGVLVVATARMRPRGALRVAGIVVTFAVVMATTVLFFASIHAAEGRFWMNPPPLP